MTMFNRQLKKLQKTTSTEKGFSIFEVIVTGLIISGFFLAGLQAIVISGILRLQAKNLSETMLWIEEDQEWIRYIASQLAYSSANCNSSDPENSFGKDLIDKVSGPNGADKDIGLERDEEPITGPESVTTFYREDLALPLKEGTGDRQFAMIRTITVVSRPPFNTIRVNYTVHDDDEPDLNEWTTLIKGTEEFIGKDKVEPKEITVEVVPDAVFRCPPP